MFLCCELSYHSVQQPCYDQVLTGILPYDDSDKDKVVTDIRGGKRPSRPTDRSQNQWLPRPVWNVITTCWSTKPERRHELSVVYRVFSEYGRREALGNLHTRNGRNLTIAKRSWTLKQGNSSVEDFSHGSLLSSSFCKGQSPKLRGALAKWIRQDIPPFPPPIPRLTRAVAS
jgi:hypothetical protein